VMEELGGKTVRQTIEWKR